MFENIFLSWRVVSVRTIRISRRLGLTRINIRDRPPYIFAVFRTLYWLFKARPKNVFVQLPQGPLLLLTALLKRVFGYRLFADVHVGFLLPVTLKEKLLNKPFQKFLSKCDIFFVHSEHMRQSIRDEKLKRRAIVLTDPLPELPPKPKDPSKELGIDVPPDKVKFIYLGSLAHDEPIELLVEAFKKASKGRAILYITGNWKKRRPNLPKIINEDIVLTGYLPWAKCMKLTQVSDVVIGLTVRGRAVMAAAIEGMAAGKPLLLSDIPAIREVFDRGAVLVRPTMDDMVKAIDTLIDPEVREKLRREILDLRRDYVRRVDKALRVVAKAMKR